MRLIQSLIIVATLSFFACKKGEDLPPTDSVMVKFVNKTGFDIQDLSVSRVEVGDIKKGNTTSDYYEYDQLGQQYGYALVEAVGTVGGKKHFTGANCQGVCGSASAPDGTWLEPGYYKVEVQIAKGEPDAMEFRVQ